MSEQRKKSLKVQYFAVLREQAGQDEEQVETEANAPWELFGELRARHGFTLDPDNLKVVVNDQFESWTHKLADGDTVVFIPPVAGG
ncbi:MAG: MoaD/ThiS family protein [Candidatus Hydrogenedentales bacterium]